MKDKIIQIAATYVQDYVNPHVYGLSQSGKLFIFSERSHKWVFEAESSLYYRKKDGNYQLIEDVEDER